ncbi:hypothetical protein HYPSUDRAFT_693174 [Hypholoma sublateritium FD-334 SS-4]|uniref:Uncharacterized protein n=1 Tax=Hypholoma sublateritium (strain FD-334 SS-4) TaxID=945553 RepID=A0A0D2Q9H4_HYPSF|nr:hypothetical protein HYPSUDRAFT_693174 [Hypholoma sublateritium FD-334 SS-4]
MYVKVLERPSIPASASHSPCTSSIIHLFDALAAQEPGIVRCGTTRPLGFIPHILAFPPHVQQATFVELQRLFCTTIFGFCSLTTLSYYLLPPPATSGRPWTSVHLLFAALIGMDGGPDDIEGRYALTILLLLFYISWICVIYYL